MSGDTRDWLLKKLLKADRAIVEQQTEIVRLKERLMRSENTVSAVQREANMRLEAASLPWAAERAHLLERIKQMAPEKQFRIEARSVKGRRLPPVQLASISSANGVTTITVERA